MAKMFNTTVQDNARFGRNLGVSLLKMLASRYRHD